jgi:exodeoxyribonuclease VIII
VNIEQEERKLINAGWYKELNNEDYHSSGGVSSTTLKKLIKKTAAHLHHGVNQVFEPTASMMLGTICHSLVLEPEKFDSEFIVMPEGLKKPTSAQINAKKHTDKTLTLIHNYTSFMDLAEGKEVITSKQHESALEMSESVLGHESAGALMQDKLVEQSIYWWYNAIDPEDDNEYKTMAKVRPDALSYAYPICIDLKTTVDATYEEFQRTILKFGYHVSAAMYLDGINQNKELLAELGHININKFVFIVVENTAPYLTAVYEMDSEFLDYGRALYRRCMLKYAQSKNSGEWPEFPPQIRKIDAPSWAQNIYTV